jgi:hypothetical protein
MPQPGDLIAAFSPQPGRCFRMVQSRQLQATHCYEPPAWKGIWCDRTGRSWYVEACREHALKVTSTAVGASKSSGRQPRIPAPKVDSHKCISVAAWRSR